jgi:IS30 family transposase
VGWWPVVAGGGGRGWCEAGVRSSRYVASTGGVRPAPRRRSERCLSEREREEISRGLARGDGFRAIAGAVGRSHTTVAREVNRNGGRAGYRAHDADEAAWRRARRPRCSKLAVNSCLRAIVADKLALRWSPEQVRGGCAGPILMM